MKSTKICAIRGAGLQCCDMLKKGLSPVKVEGRGQKGRVAEKWVLCACGSRYMDGKALLVHPGHAPPRAPMPGNRAQWMFHPRSILTVQGISGRKAEEDNHAALAQNMSLRGCPAWKDEVGEMSCRCARQTVRINMAFSHSGSRGSPRRLCVFSCPSQIEPHAAARTDVTEPRGRL